MKFIGNSETNMEALNLTSAHLELEMRMCTGNINIYMSCIRDLKCVMRKLRNNPSEAVPWQILEEGKNGGRVR